MNKSKDVYNQILRERIAKIEKLNEDSRSEFTDFWMKKLTSEESTLQIVIIGHLYIESIVDEILTKILYDSSKIIREFSFIRKLDLINSTGAIVEKFYIKIIALNSIRNKYAHNLDFKIKKEDIIKFKPTKNEINEWNTSELLYLMGEISYISGYLHALRNTAKKYRPNFLSIEDLQKIKSNAP